MRLAISVIRLGTGCTAHDGYTKDISSGGVLFTGDREPKSGEPIEYTITLSHNGPQRISLRCFGKVLRAGPIPFYETHSGFQVAATLERYEFIRGGPAAQMGMKHSKGGTEIEAPRLPARFVKEWHVAGRLKLVR
jgi:hypothetical protein